MKTRKLAQGLYTSAIGLGCYSMSDKYGAHDDIESVATLRQAVDMGITLFDTADVYGPFANEALIGHALADVRERVVIATKFGIVRASDGQSLGVNGTPGYVHRSCELSLQRLGTSYIDIYIQHRVDPKTPTEETIGAMAELVRAGKVRHIGLSEASASTIRRAHAVHPISVVQSEYSLWCRDVEQDVLPVCRELGIGFMAYAPLGRGFLAGAFAQPSDLAADDYRRLDPRFQGEALRNNRALALNLAGIAREIGCSPAQLALAWVLSRGDDVVPIPGTKRRVHLAQNVSALDISLSAAQLQSLEAAVPSKAVQGDRYADMSQVDGT